MPGETRDDVIRAVRQLGAQGTPTVITYLGENVTTDTAADYTLDEYLRVLDRLHAERGDAHLSVKLTQLGWDVDASRAMRRTRTFAHAIAAHGSRLIIDMESSPYVDATLQAYEALLSEYPNTGLCLQAYLHRTVRDVRRLLPLQPYIRLVKGAYREPETVALQRRADVDARYHALARDLLAATGQGTRVVFGTHDLRLIGRLRVTARDYGIAAPDFEIQMLYGIHDAGRRALAASGVSTRVLIAYGRAWYPWFMRRLAEKPSNLLLVGRNLLS